MVEKRLETKLKKLKMKLFYHKYLLNIALKFIFTTGNTQHAFFCML